MKSTMVVMLIPQPPDITIPSGETNIIAIQPGTANLLHSSNKPDVIVMANFIKCYLPCESRLLFC